MIISETIKSILEGQLKMKETREGYVGMFEDLITGDTIKVKATKSADSFGITQLAFFWSLNNGKSWKDEYRTLDQMLEALGTHLNPLGMYKVVQFLAELKVPYSVDDDAEDYVKGAIIEDAVLKKEGITLVTFERTASWNSLDYFNGKAAF